MLESSAPLSGSSNTQPGHGLSPSPVENPGIRESAPPPADTGSSPLGLAEQYERAPRIPTLHNQLSITGATRDDPAGARTRRQVLSDPEWASPLRGIWNVAMQGYVTSMFTYWLCYGFMLMFGLGLAQWFLGGSNLVTPEMMAQAVVVGPLYGFLLDFALIVSPGAASIGGLILLGAEVFLALVFLTTFEWRARFKYCGLMFVLVLVKMVLYVWASARG